LTSPTLPSLPNPPPAKARPIEPNPHQSENISNPDTLAAAAATLRSLSPHAFQAATMLQSKSFVKKTKQGRVQKVTSRSRRHHRPRAFFAQTQPNPGRPVPTDRQGALPPRRHLLRRHLLLRLRRRRPQAQRRCRCHPRHRHQRFRTRRGDGVSRRSICWRIRQLTTSSCCRWCWTR
jgi:hypothetical protein